MSREPFPCWGYDESDPAWQKPAERPRLIARTTIEADVVARARRQRLEARVDEILAQVKAEVLRAALKHAPMNSAHEGHSVLREEVDELWDHVKADTGYSPEALTEAKQVAAMGVRYILDLEGRE